MTRKFCYGVSDAFHSAALKMLQQNRVSVSYYGSVMIEVAYYRKSIRLVELPTDFYFSTITSSLCTLWVFPEQCVRMF